MSVEETIENVLRSAQQKAFYLVKDESAAVDHRYKLVAEVYADRNILKEIKSLLESGEIRKVTGDTSAVPG